VGLFSQNTGKIGGEIASRTISECLFRCGKKQCCALPKSRVFKKSSWLKSLTLQWRLLSVERLRSRSENLPGTHIAECAGHLQEVPKRLKRLPPCASPSHPSQLCLSWSVISDKGVLLQHRWPKLAAASSVACHGLPPRRAQLALSRNTAACTCLPEAGLCAASWQGLRSPLHRPPLKEPVGECPTGAQDIF